MKHINLLYNQTLSFMPLPFAWKGNTLDARGRFVNREHPFNDSFWQVLKWQTMRNPQKQEKLSDTWRLPVTTHENLLGDRDCIMWLGHASFYIRLAGFAMLIDPVLFNVSFMKRRAPVPVPVASLRQVDYILISHDHRDHCDAASLKVLSQQNPDATYLTGLRMKTLLHGLTGSNRIQEAGWYQQYRTPEAINIYYLPTRHWSRRGLGDTNKRLWGGFVIQGAGKTIYFGGDSGMGSHFAEVGQLFPQIDYALIGIGAYKPEFFMSQAHISPTDAVTAFKDTHAKHMIPMHYGTFDLSDEPLGDPLRVLQQTGAEGVIPVGPGEMVWL